MGDSARDKRLAHAFELAHGLAEDQRLVFVADEVVDEFEERLELGAGQRLPSRPACRRKTTGES